MDSLTQIVLGAAAGEAIIGKKVGNKAMLWGAIAGTIPDLDVMAKLFFDPVTANEMHRGFSHSILFSLLAAPILGWIVAKIYRNKEADWKDWTKLMFLGLFTHPLLDAFTTWGTQLFWPVTYKVSFKNIFVVDPLYTLPFLICVIMAMCYRRTNPRRSKVNTLGLVISSAYMVLTLVFKWITYEVFRTNLEDQQIAYKEIQTKPTPLNSVLWSANIETDTSFLIGYYSLLQKDKIVTFTEFPKNHEVLGHLQEDPLVTRLIELTEGWYTIEQKNGKTYFNDLRFGLLGMPPDADTFVFSYELYDKNGVLQARETKKDMKDAGPLLKKLFARVVGLEK